MQNIFSASALYQTILAIKEKSPLIHNITNLVVMETSANILLALGASPIMAHAKEELVDILSIAHALVLNMGTLDRYWLASIEEAQTIALQKNLPVIFDPVGAGTSVFRVEQAKRIIQRGVTVLRGNASEILALAEDLSSSAGIDSKHDSEAALDAARFLSRRYCCCVVVSGKKDIICHRHTTFYLTHGTPLLTRVTGMGCSATALIAAFASVVKECARASLYAVATLNLAAEKAERSSSGPGTFYPALLDTLYTLKLSDVARFHCEAVSHD